jgi:hypothetical protein
LEIFWKKSSIKKKLFYLLVMFKKITLLSCSLFLLSGCGEIELPQTNVVPSPAATIAATPQPVTDPNATPAPSTTNTPAQSCQEVESERDNLKEAVAVSQEELKSCLLVKGELEAKQSSGTNSSANIEKYKGFLEKYLAEVKQKEYPFEICGSIGKVTAEKWYPDFVLQLKSSGIQFGPLNRALKTDDLAGVCASNTGNVALFLGASYKGKDEFHMLRYDIATKKIEEAVLLNGTCEICPNKFGKRDGATIGLIGELGTKKVEYNYYYDSNIIKQK